MVKKRISNYLLFITTISIVAVIIITKTVVVIHDRHDEKLLYAMHSKVEYFAKRCYLEERCFGPVTLENLYENDYIKEEVVNPITKEVVDHNLQIDWQDGKVVINW
jgi:hypothetical protein